jgi:ribosomal protein S27AE
MMTDTDTAVEVTIPNERLFTLDYIPIKCPHCGTMNIRHDDLRIWYCGVCGSRQDVPIQEDMKMTEAIMRPVREVRTIVFVCTQCGASDVKSAKAKRVLCSKCEKARINANRRRGIQEVVAYKYYNCIKCGKTIVPGTKHISNSSNAHGRKRWNNHCYESGQKSPSVCVQA